jgi:hypothetical protein
VPWTTNPGLASDARFKYWAIGGLHPSAMGPRTDGPADSKGPLVYGVGRLHSGNPGNVGVFDRAGGADSGHVPCVGNTKRYSGPEFFLGPEVSSSGGGRNRRVAGATSSQIRGPSATFDSSPDPGGPRLLSNSARAMRVEAVTFTKCGRGLQGGYCPAVSHARPPGSTVSRPGVMGSDARFRRDGRLVFGGVASRSLVGCPGVTTVITLPVEAGVRHPTQSTQSGMRPIAAGSSGRPMIR